MTFVTIGRRAAWAGIAAASLLLAGMSRAQAGGGPENVFLIVNANGAKSKEVANHYIALRNVPPANVFYVPAPPNAVRMQGADFREKILRPALAEMERRGIRDHIDHIVYSCEFPFMIDCAQLLGLPVVPADVKRPMASLTGATYLWQFVEEASPSLVELNTNFYFAPTVGETTASRAFRSRLQWRPDNTPGATGGLRYFLSTQLGCSQPEGNTVDETIAYLKRAAAADGTRPPGTFFYMKNADIRSTVRDPGFATAVAELRALGVKAEIGNGISPPQGQAVAGLTTGAVHVRLAPTQLAPGALVDNFTSSGGVLTRVANPNPQTRISEYLRLGAAGASGTVIEPRAVAEKFPTPALHVHYARGCTMAESFYQSVQGPFQLLILGDPLCQPWAQIPQVTVAGVAQDAIVSGTIEIVPSATWAAGRALQRYELWVDGRPRGERRAGQKFALDTTKLGDGYHELRIIAVDDSPIEIEGRWVGGVMVKNGRDALSVTSPAGPRPTGPALALHLTSTVDGEMAVYHNNRELGRVTGKQGTVNVPLEKLGRGPVTIEARMIGEGGLRSRPLELEIP
jgi:hypothetical protein